MKRTRTEPRLPREGVTHLLALGCLLIMGGLVLAGPSGLLAWSENLRLLEQRQKEVQQLTAERDDLRNRVALLDPRHADPDLAGELLRSNLNVVHPDEMVMLLKR
ncbi:septum formation initiator family protein [Novosphingobium piscinae]|uniref:Septum formation initiator family protein n=1 Tax=Novosphingobium piscinae TaxID=1507448 RepID=A0A7X1FYU9_9SPHN|nr:septum formation initiator family protein [Novosphingobium piscinae]MBC2669501.1 septum formation initiator family protein [Novosphingobium piscinae]